MTRSCESCEFWARNPPVDNTSSKIHLFGQCRIRSPHPEHGFAETQEKCWCGEFKRIQQSTWKGKPESEWTDEDKREVADFMARRMFLGAKP